MEGKGVNYLDGEAREGDGRGITILGDLRHPSPWQDVAHNLSATSLPPLAQLSPTPPLSVSFTPNEVDNSVDQLSTSQALRNWERLLALPHSDFRRHQLVHPSSVTVPERSAPKLAAERDKDGHIEYKLKLIDPSPERFERLVTQMMWRLKEGRNEAIYELGLADDGTVIGLSRPEMDASLRTLELMASEVGATVMVLKEIVLTGSISNPPSAVLPHVGTSLASSTTSMCSSTHSLSDGSWIIHRPDLDESGRPRKGTNTVDLSGPRSKSRRREKDGLVKEGYSYRGKSQTARPIIFDDFDDGSDESSLDSPWAGPSRSSVSDSPSVEGGESQHLADIDDTPTFFLDLDEPPIAAKEPPRRWQDPPKWHKSSKPQSLKSEEERMEQERKAESKRQRSAARREERRLDLLRGDGMTIIPNLTSLSVNTTPTVANDPLPQHHTQIVLPHRPNRPSSLRLATPVSSPEDSFLDSLLHIPLDSLSLSFADVRTITNEGKPSSHPSSSPSSTTEYAMSPDRLQTLLESSMDGNSQEDNPPAEIADAIRYQPPPPGGEMICVEALVVRKMQHEEGGEEGEWGYDGGGDVWGFGVEDD